MERRKPLQPGKPLQRSGPLNGGTPLRRAAPLPRQRLPRPIGQPPKPPAPRRRTGATREVRDAVQARDKGRCVRCGAPATDLDHVQGRGAGGTKGAASDRINGPAWLRTLCGHGNNEDGCHGWRESRRGEAERLGYRLARNGVPRDASRVPCLTRHGWVLFGDDATITPCPPPPGGDARNAPADLKETP